MTAPDLLARVLRFAVVGVGNTAVGLSLIWVAWHRWGWADLAANAFGYAGGFMVSFVLHRGWTFRHRGHAGASLARFALVMMTAYAVNLVVLASTRAAWPDAGFWPQVLAVLAYAATCFVGSQWWAFRESTHAQPRT